jgi:NAD(P)-dependent dehydrogenase (short-subunit alcohol dehydrogenase family)
MNKKIALVTGANRGLGLEVVKQLSALDYIVYQGMRDLKNVDDTIICKTIIPIFLDVTNLDSIKKAKEIIESEQGHLDILVNNAAILFDNWHDISNVDLATINKAFETNTAGPLIVTQSMLPLILKSKHGRIVNVSSELGSLASMPPNSPAYNISKVALNGVTKMFAGLLHPNKILVNSVCPGWTHTDMGGGGRPIPEGAKSIVWAATLSDDGPTGEFFRDGKKLKW